MKVQREHTEVTTIGTGAVHRAKIKESPKAFHILSSSLYSDKILAVVRELSCNAYDAQVAAGRGNVPFEVKLPSMYDQTFYVKDTGTGLSEDQVYNLFMVYFESTKQDSDDFIGQLGLGCKSPFSYASTFTIESRQGGVKKVYSAYRDSDLMPVVTKMAEGSTDEHDGLTVSMAVRPDDVSKFVSAARTALAYFEVKPTVTGNGYYVPYDIAYYYEGTGWKVRSRDTISVYTGPRVVQGHVSYPVDINIIRETLGNDFHENIMEHYDILRSMDLDLFVPIGQVNIAPSREALSYDKATAANLQNILINVMDEMIQAVQQKLSAECKTFWEAHLFLNDAAKHGFGSDAMLRYIKKVRAAKTFKFNMVDISDHVTYWDSHDGKKWEYDQIHMCSYQTEFRANRVKPPAHAHMGMIIRASRSTIFLIDDRTNRRGVKNQLAEYLKAQRLSGVHTVFMISSISDNGVVDQVQLNKLLDELGNPPVVLASTLPPPPKTKYYTYTKKVSSEVSVWAGFHTTRTASSGFSPKCWTTETVELSDGGFYVELERYTIVAEGVTGLTGFDRVLRAARDLGHLPEDVTVIGIPQRKVDELKKSGPWINVFDHLRERFAEDEAKGIYAHSLNVNVYRQWVANNTIEGAVVNEWQRLAPSVTNDMVKDFFDDLSVNLSSSGIVDVVAIEAYLSRGLGKLTTERKTYSEIETAWREVKTTMPMYNFVHINRLINSPTEGDRILLATLNGTL